MTAPDFKSLLARPLDEVKEPPNPPAGTYYGNITKFEFKQTPWENEDTGEKDLQVAYTIRNIEAGPDVVDEVANTPDLNLEKQVRVAQLPVTGGNEYVTKKFLESLGIWTPGSGKGFGELCPEAVGHSVMFDLTHRPNKNDPTARPFIDVRNLRKRP